MEMERNSKPIKEISLVPLIDVSFLILVFFMLGGTLEKTDMIPIDLPHATSGEILDEGHVSVVMGEHGEVILNDEPIMLTDLQRLLRDQLQHNKNRVITIKADSHMDAARLIAVMDHIKAAGGINISLITRSD